MSKRVTRIALPLTLAAAVAVAVALSAVGTSVACARDAVAGVAGGGSPLSKGKDPVALVGQTLVTIGPDGTRAAYVHGEALGGILRHVSARPGSGVAYVEDRRGSDGLTLVTSKDSQTVVPGGEITHPAWSSEGDLAYAVDLERLEVRTPGAPVRTIDRPEGAVGVFSPVFTTPETIVAVVQEAIPGVTTHDDTLNNLWSHDLTTGEWARLTAFSADAHRWSVVRTPVAQDTGQILFVREVGQAISSEPPSYELWALRETGAEKVRELPGEMFLAAAGGDGLLWNVFSEGEWRLFLEGPEGTRSIGCGAVMVDPRTSVDPDHEDQEEAGKGLPSAEEVLPADGEMGIVIGDFETRAEAAEVAATLGLVGGRVVEHEEAPSAVMPDVFAVAIPLPGVLDLEQALDDFRDRYPEYATKTWLVSLAGGQA
ncbi:MAG TPA: hypothetical protein VGB28_04535 [Actinomycetota bacterium]|jgi:hypothetical protein